MFTECNWCVKQAASLKSGQKTDDEYTQHAHISNLIKSEIVRHHLIGIDEVSFDIPLRN